MDPQNGGASAVVSESNSSKNGAADHVIQSKLATALKFKEEGNEFYKAKNYKKAMRQYHNARMYLKGIDTDLHGTPAFLQSASVDPNSSKKVAKEVEDQCIAANISIYNNLAACLLASPDHQSEADFEKVVTYADIVLELDPENDKAMYRKAQALKKAKNFSKAKDTLEELVKVSKKKSKPIPKDVAEDMKLCQEMLKNYDLKAKAMYENMFASGQKWKEKTFREMKLVNTNVPNILNQPHNFYKHYNTW